MKRIPLKKIALLALCTLMFSCEKDATPPIEENIIPMEKPSQLYSTSSPFNQKIPDNPEIDSNSTAMVATLKEAYDVDSALVLGLKEWTVTVFYADSTTPRYDVPLNPEWTTPSVMKDVPIPSHAVPDPEDDGHMVIIDRSTNREYDFWQVKKSDGKWSASWGNSIPFDSDGIYEDGGSCRGSGFALLAGLVWPEELKAGVINHALVFSYPVSKKGVVVYPATETDGHSERDDAIPEGARIQLDPNLDLSTLDLEPWEVTIAKALQEYGMILCDNSGGFEIEAINKLSYTEDPYKDLLTQEWDYAFFRKIPVDKFRVLKMTITDQWE